MFRKTPNSTEYARVYPWKSPQASVRSGLSAGSARSRGVLQTSVRAARNEPHDIAQSVEPLLVFAAHLEPLGISRLNLAEISRQMRQIKGENAKKPRRGDATRSTGLDESLAAGTALLPIGTSAIALSEFCWRQEFRGTLHAIIRRAAPRRVAWRISRGYRLGRR